MSKKHVTVTQENKTGRNQKFHDNRTDEDMTRAEFVKKIEQRQYDDYHVRKINDVKTPVSNPDKTTDDNLG